MIPSPIFVFDAYGTLFDVHSAVHEYAADIGSDVAQLSALWRAKTLEYTWIHAAMADIAEQPVPTFQELSRRALNYALATVGKPASLTSPLLSAAQRLESFPEVPDNLRALHAAGARLAILSNADPETLESLVAHANLTNVFEFVISARPSGTYKPARAVYRLATDAFACAPSAITFVSSNRWDCAGAKAFGFTTICINRASAAAEYPASAPDHIVQSLSAAELKRKCRPAS